MALCAVRQLLRIFFPARMPLRRPSCILACVVTQHTPTTPHTLPVERHHLNTSTRSSTARSNINNRLRHPRNSRSSSQALAGAKALERALRMVTEKPFGVLLIGEHKDRSQQGRICMPTLPPPPTEPRGPHGSTPALARGAAMVDWAPCSCCVQGCGDSVHAPPGGFILQSRFPGRYTASASCHRPRPTDITHRRHTQTSSKVQRSVEREVDLIEVSSGISNSL